MAKPEYRYAIGDLSAEEAAGLKETSFLFRSDGEKTQVRVNRTVKQVEVIHETTVRIYLDGCKFDDYINRLNEATEGLSDVTVAVYQDSFWDFEEEGPEQDENVDISPRLVVTGWTENLTDVHMKALDNAQGFL